jgi:hypothetical protein
VLRGYLGNQGHNRVWRDAGTTFIRLRGLHLVMICCSLQILTFLCFTRRTCRQMIELNTRFGDGAVIAADSGE